MKNKTKAWRRQACPRDETGRKIKGKNRRLKLHDRDFQLPTGASPLLLRLMERAGILVENN